MHVDVFGQPRRGADGRQGMHADPRLDARRTEIEQHPREGAMHIVDVDRGQAVGRVRTGAMTAAAWQPAQL